MSKLKVLDLFSGIGGFSLGLERTQGFQTVAFCEIEEFPRRVLAKHWPEVHCHKDIRTLTKETLWSGYAENAVLVRLCKATGGNLASARFAIETIRENAAGSSQISTTNGPLSADEALLNIMAGSAPVAGKRNTHFWRSITLITTAAKNAKPTNELLGKSLSSADFQTIIKFFVTTAIWQNPSTDHALMKRALGDDCYHDVRELTADALRRDGIEVDIICGGFPCQDVSNAGPRLGLVGERSGLWSEITRLAGELRPRFLIVENVAALLGRGMGRVLGDLATLGFDAEWHCIPASAFGAPHARDRVWIIAYPNQEHEEGQQRRCHGSQERKEPAPRSVGLLHRTGRLPSWPAEPSVGRVGHGFPNRMDRAGALGNAVVPQIPELIGHAILEAERAQP